MCVPSVKDCGKLYHSHLRTIGSLTSSIGSLTSSYIYIHIYVYTYVYMYICIYLFIYPFIYVYSRVYVFTHLFMFAFLAYVQLQRTAVVGSESASSTCLRSSGHPLSPSSRGRPGAQVAGIPSLGDKSGTGSDTHSLRQVLCFYSQGPSTQL